MKKKILMIVGTILCAALLVAGSVMGTVAYLTAKATITNVFTVGDVDIELDESTVTTAGVKVENADRRHTNEYHLLPGTTYVKDPRITITSKSESSYVFVKIDNGLKEFAVSEQEYEADKKTKLTIAKQLESLGWKSLKDYADTNDAGTPSNADNVYVFLGVADDHIAGNDADTNESVKMDTNNRGFVVHNVGDGDIYIWVFKTFSISKNANFDNLKDEDNNGKIDPKIEITAYSVQANVFNNPVDAWNDSFGKNDTGTTPPSTETSDPSTQG